MYVYLNMYIHVYIYIYIYKHIYNKANIEQGLIHGTYIRW